MSTFTKLRDTFFSFIEGPLWNFLKPFVDALESQGSTILIAAAENAVAVGFATAGGGQVAMAAALASFSAEVVEKGLPFVESQARALIEVALQKAKTSTASPVVAETPAIAATPAA